MFHEVTSSVSPIPTPFPKRAAYLLGTFLFSLILSLTFQNASTALFAF
jgi:hypothetical protein